jgi:hypothetical protein
MIRNPLPPPPATQHKDTPNLRRETKHQVNDIERSCAMQDLTGGKKKKKKKKQLLMYV